MSASTDDTIPVEMESSSFSQVVFNDVPHVYPPNISVTCFYTLTGGLKPTTKDWIGIYKVGWTSTTQYHTYVWVKVSSDQVGQESVIQKCDFHESYLPKDDGEFYQFCYVDGNGQVKGASTPFSFSRTPVEGGLDCSLEQDLLVITTQEQAEKMEQEREELLKKINLLSDENKILKNELDDRLKEIHRLRMQMEKSSQDKSELQSEPPKEKEPESSQQEQTLLGTSFLSDYKKEVESLSCMQERYEKAVQKINMLKQERAQLREQIEAQSAEISRLNSKEKEADQEFNKLQDEVQLLKVDLQSSRKENERLLAEMQEVRDLKVELEGARTENQSLRATLSEEEQVQKQALLKQLTDARGLLRQEIQNSKDAQKRAERLEQELRQTKEELEQRAVVLDQKNQKSSEFEAELKNTQRRLTEQEVAYKEVTEENENLRSELQKLQQTVIDLQIAAVSAAGNSIDLNLTPPPSSTTQPQSPTNPPIYENFPDIPGNPSGANNQVLVCQHCQEHFPDISEDELAIHEQSHKVCPFCTLICDTMDQQEFEDHVYSHEE
ncbi:calcium-binding and coiled-coil domain-containing protein 2 [Chanos chanos]|uniref:Calcium-binding and coiled-coil domain-containing protein 2 n=1 Tax=Chanos chanos TaxID=29144 RepID=A0A6J2VED8_CHACN|nr:calcium-binding and coiled-coil domain-containing protein 2-like [Chanos chanos]